MWALPWLACNFPKPKPVAPGTGSEALRQTMQAVPSSPGVEATQVYPGSGPVDLSPVPGTAFPDTTPLPVQATSVNGSPDVDGLFTYTVQSGDTLDALSARFGVQVGQLVSGQALPERGYLPAGYTLYIPWQLGEVLPSEPLLPDSEVVFSPTSVDFDLGSFVQEAGGYLSVYSQEIDNEAVSGIELIRRVANQASINPRLLLALLEYRSGWVYGFPADPERAEYPFGFYIPGRSGLYEELQIIATQLNVGYYGWRQGSRLTVKFSDQKIARINPNINPGTAALQHLMAMFYRQDDWQSVLYAPAGFPVLYSQMFGDPWERDAISGALIPDGLSQPVLEFPFQAGERWSFTAGPHAAWDSGTPRGAIDFSPVSGGAACAVSSWWARAAAPGVIARAERNAVVLDLDGDGYEQTGWVLLYYHLAESELIRANIQVDLDDVLGHPSCEGGRATGKHVHIARKYNGEWMAADGPVPFVLSGWLVVADEKNYHGLLVRGEQTVTSNPSGNQTSIIVR
jgi:murein DD-endopeptidase MepM/ murein hydrolase activator NlpD